MDKWIILVIRNDGTTTEILNELYDHAETAHEQARWHLTRWRGVTLEVAKVFVPLNGEKVDVK